MKEIPQNVTESVRKRNPHLYDLGAVVASQPQCSPRLALDSAKPKRQRGKGCVEVVVTIIACCFREADDDNNMASLKGIRDGIAETLGIDDGDRRIRFEYGQIETRAERGLIVKIELL